MCPSRSYWRRGRLRAACGQDVLWCRLLAQDVCKPARRVGEHSSETDPQGADLLQPHLYRGYRLTTGRKLSTSPGEEQHGLEKGAVLRATCAYATNPAT